MGIFLVQNSKEAFYVTKFNWKEKNEALPKVSSKETKLVLFLKRSFSISITKALWILSYGTSTLKLTCWSHSVVSFTTTLAAKAGTEAQSFWLESMSNKIKEPVETEVVVIICPKFYEGKEAVFPTLPPMEELN